MKNGAVLESTCVYGRPINVVAKHGSNDIVVALLAAGSPVDDNPDVFCSCNPLQDAARGGHTTVATTLLANGANVNFGSVSCWTALHVAAAQNHADVVDLLAHAGADLDPVAGEDTETRLHRVPSWSFRTRVRSLC